MNRIKWELEEAVVLFELYFGEGQTLSVPIEKLEHLSRLFFNRACTLGLEVDEKYRNVSGLKLQLACVHYVVTGGRSGMANVSKLFCDTYDLYLNDKDRYNAVLNAFHAKYGV